MPDATDDREAMRLLKRLAGKSGSGIVAPPDLLRRLTRRGLISGAEASPVLTALGRTTLRRHLAGADAFAHQHQTRSDIVLDEGNLGPVRVAVNQDESPLARLRRLHGRDGKPLIDAAEFAAGERLRADFTRGQMMPRVTSNWGAAVAARRRDGGSGGAADITDAVIAARLRVERALTAVGPDFAGLLVDFCCFLKGIEEIERERLWPARSAKLVVRLALASLARHYGLSPAARGRDEPGRLRHWGDGDYRPVID